MWRRISVETERDKSRDLFDPTDKIGKLIRMLGNGASDNEIIGAARALDRMLADSGGLPHLADIVDTHWRPPPKLKPQPEPKYEWQIMAAKLLQHPGLLIISSKINELHFLQNMRRSRACPTDKQWKWMGDIEARLPPEQRMAS